MVRKIAICSQKGGVGKTTTSINLGAALALLGHKVLLIDNDSQANATTSCGISQQDIRLSLYDILTKPDQKPDPVIRKCNLDTLWLIPASGKLVSAEMELVREMGRELILKEKMEEIEERYDYVIIDCTPGISLLVLNALFCCNEIIIPIQSQFLALEGIDQLLHAVHVIQKRMRHSIRVTGILCTMFDRRTKLSSFILQQMTSLFKEGLFGTVISVNTKLAEAPLKGNNIFEYAPSSNAADDYMALAKEVVERKNRDWKETHCRSEYAESAGLAIKPGAQLGEENDTLKYMIESLKPLISAVMSVDHATAAEPEAKTEKPPEEGAPEVPKSVSDTGSSAAPSAMEEENVLWG